MLSERQLEPHEEVEQAGGEHDLRAGERQRQQQGEAGEEGLAEGGVPQRMAPVRGPRRHGRGSWEASVARAELRCAFLLPLPESTDVH